MINHVIGLYGVSIDFKKVPEFIILCDLITRTSDVESCMIVHVTSVYASLLVC